MHHPCCMLHHCSAHCTFCTAICICLTHVCPDSQWVEVNKERTSIHIVRVNSDKLAQVHHSYYMPQYCTVLSNFFKEHYIWYKNASFSSVATSPFSSTCLCGSNSFGTLQHLPHIYLPPLQKKTSASKGSLCWVGLLFKVSICSAVNPNPLLPPFLGIYICSPRMILLGSVAKYRRNLNKTKILILRLSVLSIWTIKTNYWILRILVVLNWMQGGAGGS